MSDGIFQRRHASPGQAAVESALALPVSLFVVLGLLQMGMLQQARFMADYAAYRGARAASVQRLECKFVVKAEIAALVPSLGRSDDYQHWISTYNANSTGKDGSRPIALSHWKLSNHQTPFDKPLGPNDDPERVTLQLRYYYQMNVPFANWLFAKFFMAQQGVQAWNTAVDPLSPSRQFGDSGGGGGGDAAADFAIVKDYYNQKKYVAPIYASWSMRMFSQASQEDVSSGSGDCP